MTDENKFCFQMPSGKLMPAIGFGTYAPKNMWSLKTGDPLKDYLTEWFKGCGPTRQMDDDEIFAAVRAAVKLGYRHLDCAAIYRNERAVGQAIKQLIVEDTVRRKDLFITSKLWNTCHSPDLVRESLLKSLDDLGLEYLDCYLIHWPMGYKEGGEFYPRDENGKVLFSDVDFLDTWKALEDCKDEGLVKNIGLSNFNSQQIQRILDIARIKPCVNQVELHLHLANSKLVEFCEDKGIVVVAYSPLGSPGNNSVPHTASLEEPVIKEIAKEKQKTTAQIILRFLLQRKIAVIPKTVTSNRIQENFQVFDFELTDEEMKQIHALNMNYRLNSEEPAKLHKYYPFNCDF